MRPKRLELAGFTAFREPTVIDFDGSDLFALVGPTGSGKSSLIDAIVFALYGSIPRYQDERLVAPAVSQGRNEARVRLDFTIGSNEYSAVRVVRRTQNGATTKEARLECRGEVLAGDAKALTEQVESVIGLTFDQFNKCVVLPQGEFAKFLNDKPAARQDLLVKLLGFGLYEQIRGQASSLAADALNRIKLSDEELQSLAEYTKETEKEARAALGAIEAVQKAFQKDSPSVVQLEKQIDGCNERVARCEEDIEHLSELKAPKVVQQLAAEKRTRENSLADAESTAKERDAKLAKAQKDRDELGDAAPLIEAKERYGDLESTRKSADTSKKQLTVHKREAQDAERAEREAKDGLKAAQRARDEVHRSNMAHALREGLAVGEACPVCEQPVRRVPATRALKGVSQADRDVVRAEADVERASEARAQARERLSKTERELELAAKRIATLEKQLKGVATLQVIRERLAAIQELDQHLKQARTSASVASDAAKRARRDLDGFRKREEEAWSEFDSTRDDLSHLKPPSRKANKLADSWAALLSWRDERVPALRKECEKERAAIADCEKKLKQIVREYSEALRKIGYELEEDEPIHEQLAHLLAEAKAELRGITEKLNRKTVLEKTVTKSREQARVADALARHLRADRFERWLLEAAFERLVSAASNVLMELSSGAYSFAYNNRLEFEIVDHANADEQRSARTLSGGETFLASLALALTLADQVADLAARGAAKLESMFLDEGFGSLDPDALGIVATAIEELGSRGRMVGLVTHISELAERVPIQYRVTKGPSTSTVERVMN